MILSFRYTKVFSCPFLYFFWESTHIQSSICSYSCVFMSSFRLHVMHDALMWSIISIIAVTSTRSICIQQTKKTYHSTGININSCILRSVSSVTKYLGLLLEYQEKLVVCDQEEDICHIIAKFFEILKY